jgi:type I restriction enzyme S subunit
MREDWIEVEFNEVLDIVSGKNQKQVISDVGKYPIYGSGGIIGRAKEYLCEEGTTVIGRKGTINSPIYVNEQFWNVDTAFGLSPFNILNNRLLFFYAILFNFKKLDKSTTIPSLAKRDLLKINFPLPPIPEQRAIVAKIEELFSDLDKGIADLKKAQDQLVIFRQAVLKKAFEGLDEVPFEKIVASSQNGLAKRSGTEGREIKVLRLADITNLAIDNSSSRSIILSDKELEKYQLHEGDLLAIRVNGSIHLVGRFIHVTKKDEIEEWAFCDHLIRVTLDKEKCVSAFYYYFFQLPQVRKFIHQNMVSSAGQNTVSQGTVKSISVPLTSIVSQHQIVKEIETRLSVCDTVEQSITESLEKAKALRQSILKKAFEGTLLSAAEIAKCKTAKDYEPASVLLEKIKAEKKK